MELYIKSNTHGLHIVKVDRDVYYNLLYDRTIGLAKCYDKLYAYIMVDGKVVHVHKIITNSLGKLKTDHIDGDSLNNTKDNLRICTNAQNIQNSKKPKNNTSGYKGVSWCKRTKKYRVNIMVNLKYTSHGYYDNLIEAAKKYNEMALKYHGEFAFLNKL